MKEHPENLKRGQHFVVTGKRDYTRFDMSLVPFGPPILNEEIEWTGEPNLIDSVSFPFVVYYPIENGKYVATPETIDLRAYDILVIPQDYVKPFLYRQADDTPPSPEKREKERKEVHLNKCPLCAFDLKQRLKGGLWYLYCDNCTFMGRRSSQVGEGSKI